MSSSVFPVSTTLPPFDLAEFERHNSRLTRNEKIMFAILVLLILGSITSAFTMFFTKTGLFTPAHRTDEDKSKSQTAGSNAST